MTSLRGFKVKFGSVKFRVCYAIASILLILCVKDELCIRT